MPKLQKVKITKQADRPYGGVEEPELGMRGVIDADQSNVPPGHTNIRFTAKVMGYLPDPEYTHVNVYMPNDCFVNV